MKNIKLVLVDIDGTLLNDKHIVPKENIEAISNLHKKNIKFGIASGRPYTSVKNIAIENGLLEYCDYFIGSNGGEIYDIKQDKLDELSFLEKDIVKNIEKLYKNQPCVTCVYDNGIIFANKKSTALERQKKKISFESKLVDFSEAINKAYPKVILVMEPEDQASILTYSYNFSSERYKIFPSSSSILEVVNPKVSKSAGINLIKNRLNIKSNQILCFGDTTNDLEMLRDYVGVVMANGTDDVKEVAKFTTLSNNDAGIASFLNNHIL